MPTKIIFDPKISNLAISPSDNFSDPLFFTVLKLDLGFSESNNQFSLNTQNLSEKELYDILRRVIEFFVEEKQSYTLDKGATELATKANAELERHALIKKRALQLIRRKSPTAARFRSVKFKRLLKPYQEEPVHFLSEIPYAANFSVPGSGKTTMVYAAYSRLKDLRLIQKMLIIGPSAAYLAWHDEYKFCFEEDPKIVRITGDKRQRNRIYDRAADKEIFITTYQTASRDADRLIELLESSQFLLVLDESHNIKRFEGGMWSATILRLANSAHRRIILTGTPVPNNLLDLWSQFSFLDPDIIGPKAQFKALIQRQDADEILRKRLAPYYRRIKKNELDLPKPKFRTIKVRAGRLQEKIYATMRRATLEELQYAKPDRVFLKDLRRAIIIRLMQTASNPSLLAEKSEEFQVSSILRDEIVKYVDLPIVESIKRYSKLETPSKILAAEKIARQIIKRGPQKKVLIWSVFIDNLKILNKRLSDLNPVVIYGDVPINEEQDPIDNREFRIRKFKTDSSCRVMIANPGACGESISLHDVCHDAIYLDRSFNAGQYMQSLDRIHRVGLKRTDVISYYFLVVKDTIDETIHRKLEEKRTRMLRLLNDDFQVVDMETDLSIISGSSEEEEDDFSAVIRELKQTND